MPALTLNFYTSHPFGSPVYNLSISIPEPSQGKEGRELQDRVKEIIARWQKQPPRGLALSSIQLEIDPDQAAANQTAIALLQSWQDDGDEQEQRETWTYLKQALDEDRLSSRTLFQ